MIINTRSRDMLVFSVNERLRADGFAAIICSPQPRSDVALVETSWALHINSNVDKLITCSTYPLETVTHHPEAGEIPCPSEEQLIRFAGQNKVEIFASEDIPVPCLLVDRCNCEIHCQRVKVRLDIHCWSGTADFLAEQEYWIAHYEHQIATGKEYLRGRLDDYENERQLASRLRLADGDILPVNLASGNVLSSGSLRLIAHHEDDLFSGELLLAGRSVQRGDQLQRMVKLSMGSGKSKIQRDVAEILSVENE